MKNLDFSVILLIMSAVVKFSGQMDAELKASLDAYVKESGITFSAAYSEMVRMYLRSKRLRPFVLDAGEQVLNEDAELLARLAK